MVGDVERNLHVLLPGTDGTPAWSDAMACVVRDAAFGDYRGYRREGGLVFLATDCGAMFMRSDQ